MLSRTKLGAACGGRALRLCVARAARGSTDRPLTRQGHPAASIRPHHCRPTKTGARAGAPPLSARTATTPAGGGEAAAARPSGFPQPSFRCREEAGRRPFTVSIFFLFHQRPVAGPRAPTLRGLRARSRTAQRRQGLAPRERWRLPGSLSPFFTSSGQPVSWNSPLRPHSWSSPASSTPQSFWSACTPCPAPRSTALTAHLLAPLLGHPSGSSSRLEPHRPILLPTTPHQQLWIEP